MDKGRGLSTKAKKLLQRLHGGAWYSALSDTTPHIMKELVDAGLVTTGSRVKAIELCYVPVGTKPPLREVLPVYPTATNPTP